MRFFGLRVLRIRGFVTVNVKAVVKISFDMKLSEAACDNLESGGQLVNDEVRRAVVSSLKETGLSVTDIEICAVLPKA